MVGWFLRIYFTLGIHPKFNSNGFCYDRDEIEMLKLNSSMYQQIYHRLPDLIDRKIESE